MKNIKEKSPKSQKAIIALKEKVKELESQLQLKISQPLTGERVNYRKNTAKKKTLDDLKESDPENYKTIINYYKKLEMQ